MSRYKTTYDEVTFANLVGRNAFEILGVIRNLLQKLERQADLERGSISKAYMKEATAGDYDNLLRVSHRYAYDHLASTLSVARDFEEYLEDDPAEVRREEIRGLEAEIAEIKAEDE